MFKKAEGIKFISVWLNGSLIWPRLLEPMPRPNHDNSFSFWTSISAYLYRSCNGSRNERKISGCLVINHFNGERRQQQQLKKNEDRKLSAHAIQWLFQFVRFQASVYNPFVITFKLPNIIHSSVCRVSGFEAITHPVHMNATRNMNRFDVKTES